MLAGAVNLTATGWPGTGTYKAWRGAVNPYGANAYTVTVTAN